MNILGQGCQDVDLGTYWWSLWVDSRHAKKISGPRPRCRDTWQHTACRCPVTEGERYRGTAGPGAWGRTAASRSGHRRWGCRSCGCETCALGAAPRRTRCPGQCWRCSASTAVVEIKCGIMWGNIKNCLGKMRIIFALSKYIVGSVHLHRCRRPGPPPGSWRWRTGDIFCGGRSCRLRTPGQALWPQLNMWCVQPLHWYPCLPKPLIWNKWSQSVYIKGTIIAPSGPWVRLFRPPPQLQIKGIKRGSELYVGGG